MARSATRSATGTCEPDVTDSDPPVVYDPDGDEARLLAQSEGRVLLRLVSGQRVETPADLVIQDNTGGYRCTVGFDALLEAGGRLVVPVVEEGVTVSKRAHETGRVRVSKRVETREEVVDEPLLREAAEVECVPVGRYVDAPPPVREDGATTVIPVIEEVLVVEKRLFLKEEIHVTRTRTEARDPQRVTLRTERVEVERLPPAGGAPEDGPGSH